MGGATTPGEEPAHAGHDAPGHSTPPDSRIEIDQESPLGTKLWHAIQLLDIAIHYWPIITKSSNPNQNPHMWIRAF